MTTYARDSESASCLYRIRVTVVPPISRGQARLGETWMQVPKPRIKHSHKQTPATNENTVTWHNQTL